MSRSMGIAQTDLFSRRWRRSLLAGGGWQSRRHAAPPRARRAAEAAERADGRTGSRGRCRQNSGRPARRTGALPQRGWCCRARKSRTTSSTGCSILTSAPSGRNSARCVASTTTRNRFMSVDVRVGDYKLDSSNFHCRPGLPRIPGRLHGHGGHRSRLRFAAPGSLAGHRSGLQAGARFALAQARLSCAAWPMRRRSTIFPRSRRW